MVEITGGCFCGEIKYQVSIDERMIGVCHCRDCQIFSGSAFRSIALGDVDSLLFKSGKPSYFDKVADSGMSRRMAFCPVCGTHICSMPGDGPTEKYLSVRLATSDQYAQFRPVVEVFCDSKVDWLEPIKGAQQFARMPVLE